MPNQLRIYHMDSLAIAEGIERMKRAMRSGSKGGPKWLGFGVCDDLTLSLVNHYRDASKWPSSLAGT